jgi:anti-sigma regulatory factor (Ser/Thr protein kinase)
MPNHFTCTFAIRSDTRYLAVLRSWVEAAARLAGNPRLDRKAVTSLSIALVEAVDNAIFHAHRRRRSMPIGVTMSVRSEEVLLEVVDRGRGIGQLDLSEPERMASRGRGLFLIGRTMSSVESVRRGGRHALRMALRI